MFSSEFQIPIAHRTCKFPYEHKCVLDSCPALKAEGFKVTYLPAQPNGLVNLDELKEALTLQTSLVSVMTIYNEIGVRRPVEEIGRICSERKIFFHTDAVQAGGKS